MDTIEQLRDALAIEWRPPSGSGTWDGTLMLDQGGEWVYLTATTTPFTNGEFLASISITTHDTTMRVTKRGPSRLDAIDMAKAKLVTYLPMFPASAGLNGVLGLPQPDPQGMEQE